MILHSQKFPADIRTSNRGSKMRTLGENICAQVGVKDVEEGGSVNLTDCCRSDRARTPVTSPVCLYFTHFYPEIKLNLH